MQFAISMQFLDGWCYTHLSKYEGKWLVMVAHSCSYLVHCHQMRVLVVSNYSYSHHMLGPVVRSPVGMLGPVVCPPVGMEGPVVHTPMGMLGPVV